MLEYWNGSSWVTVITERTSVGGENDYHFYNRANIHGDWSLYRVTITGANTTYPSSYTGIQLLYDYSRQNLPNNFLPIAWDYRKNVGIGTSNTVTRANIYGTLTVDASGQSGNNFSEGIRLGPASNGYSIVTFGVNPASATGTIANQWWIGKHGGTNGFNINSNTTGDVVHILQNGNVGIGTTSPDGKLNVIAANTYTSLRSNAAGSYTFQSIGRTSSELELGVVGAANQFFVGTAAGEGVIKTPASKLHLGYASQTPGITIDTSNNIGIGVVAPSTKLHLSSSATAALRIETRTNSAADSEIEFVGPDTHSYSTGIDTSDSNKFKISYAATRTPPTLGTNDRFILTTAGNVGIGSSTPAAFFDVNGTSKFSGNMGVGAAPSLNARFTITGTSTSQRAVSFSTVSSRSDTTSTSYILTGWIAIYCTSLTGITNGEYYIPFYQYSP
jgi:hypothetical protein